MDLRTSELTRLTDLLRRSINQQPEDTRIAMVVVVYVADDDHGREQVSTAVAAQVSDRDVKRLAPNITRAVTNFLTRSTEIS
jgi:hypothetical protein